jgi:hypothetical protein
MLHMISHLHTVSLHVVQRTIHGSFMVRSWFACHRTNSFNMSPHCTDASRFLWGRGQARHVQCVLAFESRAAHRMATASRPP